MMKTQYIKNVLSWQKFCWDNTFFCLNNLEITYFFVLLQLG